MSRGKCNTLETNNIFISSSFDVAKVEQMNEMRICIWKRWIWFVSMDPSMWIKVDWYGNDDDYVPMTIEELPKICLWSHVWWVTLWLSRYSRLVEKKIIWLNCKHQTRIYYCCVEHFFLFLNISHLTWFFFISRVCFTKANETLWSTTEGKKWLKQV